MRLPKGSKLIRTDPCRVWRAPIVHDGGPTWLTSHIVDKATNAYGEAYMSLGGSVCDGYFVTCVEWAPQADGSAIASLVMSALASLTNVSNPGVPLDAAMYPPTPDWFVL